MRGIRTIASVAAIFLCAFAISLYAARAARGSDHQDSPTVVNRPGADITDVFTFPDPHNPSNVVLAMDVHPLVPTGQGTQTFFDPAVLYQFKVANNLANKDSQEHVVVQFTVNGTGASQTLTMYGPGAPNEIGTTNSLLATATGTVPYNRVTSFDNGRIQAFAGPRRDPFFFDLAQFFKIIPDRNYKNQPNPPPGTASSFNFASANQPIVLNGTSYGTAGSNKCTIAQPSDFLKPYNVLSIVVEVPKTMLESNGAALGKVGVWATASTTTGS
jgi:hypothetical protein